MGHDSRHTVDELDTPCEARDSDRNGRSWVGWWLSGLPETRPVQDDGRVRPGRVCHLEKTSRKNFVAVIETEKSPE